MTIPAIPDVPTTCDREYRTIVQGVLEDLCGPAVSEAQLRQQKRAVAGFATVIRQRVEAQVEKERADLHATRQQLLQIRQECEDERERICALWADAERELARERAALRTPEVRYLRDESGRERAFQRMAGALERYFPVAVGCLVLLALLAALQSMRDEATGPAPGRGPRAGAAASAVR